MNQVASTADGRTRPASTTRGSARRRLWPIGLGAVLACACTPPAGATELPVACAAGTCGASGPATFVTSGAAVLSQAGNTLTVQQSSHSAILNWASFNIAQDGRVVFSQPTTTSLALNRIYQESPSRIFGQLTANGQVYLVNPNGLIFGSTAKVSAAGILASTLGVSDSVFNNGLLSALNQSQPALAGDGRLSVIDHNGQAVLGPDGLPLQVRLEVQQGAELATNAPNGRILLAAPEVDNAGSLSAPDGQVILAAGQKVYLQASTDPSLRGLLVEVDAGGKAWNQLTGQLQAARGDVTMVGLAVNQDGRASATTTVAANGSVRLLARDTAQVTASNTGGSGTVNTVTAKHGGTLELGNGSVTEVLPELADPATAVDDQAQAPSTVELSGAQVALDAGSSVHAPGGLLAIAAAADPSSIGFATDATSWIRVAAGASIDLAGSIAELPVSANVVSVQLRANELRDSPDQRDGALRGQTVVVDARVGTPIADVSGAIAAIAKTVAQRTGQGGTASLNSNGSISVEQGADINVSGGYTQFQGGLVNTSQLITADGRLVDIGSAPEDGNYVAVLNPTASVVHDRWGVVQTLSGQSAARFEPGYLSGSSAGTIQLQAPLMSMLGTLQGAARNGPYQRSPASSQFAQGGRLVIGSTVGTNGDYRAPDILLLEQAAAAATSAAGAATPLQLSAADLAAAGFTRLDLRSNGTISVTGGAPVALADGSALTLRAQHVDLLTGIVDQGGSLDVAAVPTVASTTASTRSGITVGDGVVLDVRGTWINDLELSDPLRPVAPLLQDGGSISLVANVQGSLLSVGDAAWLLADGGAWINRAGSAQGGKGGSITLSSGGRDSALRLGQSTRLQAFGVNAAAGGQLSLAAGSLQLVNGTAWAPAQTYDPSHGGPAPAVQLGTALFDSLGFGRISLVATGGTPAAQGEALQIAAGTDLRALTATMILDAGAASHASGGNTSLFSSLTQLPDYQRSPMSVSLSVNPYSGYAGARLGNLDVQAGSSVSADAGGSLTLASYGGAIDLAGSVQIHGGAVRATVFAPPNSDVQGYDPELGITVAPGALLDVSGAALLQPNDAGLLQGAVLSGGSLGLAAHRGFLAIEPGATLDVSGTVQPIDIRTGAADRPYQREQVASAAGALSLQAAESLDLLGTLLGQAGVGDSGRAAGGSLSLRMTRDSASLPTVAALIATFPSGPRTIEVGTASGSNTVNGLVRIPVQTLLQGGFDSLQLTADSTIRLDAGSQIAYGRRLAIDAPAIVVAGTGEVALSAPYISLGNSRLGANAALASGGQGVLDLYADFIDLAGNTVLQGISQATFNSTGDIQLRGLAQNAGISGALTLAGDLTLAAERVFATSASQFLLSDPGHAIRFASTGTATSAPLSAASQLTVSAADIIQGGAVYAPFGSIELDASGAIQLAAGSLTTASGNGGLIPYGMTVNGTDWVYAAGTGTPIPVTRVPARRVTLSANAVSIDAGATVDVSGGGDLHSYEWVSGAGGTIDALAAGVPDQYAILPSLGAGFAPYDAQDYAGSTLRPGDTVYLSPGSGVPAGYYSLLPARYALLPGAYLVSKVAGSTDLQPGAASALPDGTPVVAGFLSFGSSGIGGTRYAGFSVLPGNAVHALAQYNDTLASQFFSNAAASGSTADAGLLSLNATAQLAALGKVQSLAAQGGIGASVEISSRDLTIVGPDSGAVGGVTLQADVLSGWHAARLLLGGSRRADGQGISVTADTVTVAPGAALTADEVVMVAAQAVSVESGARVATHSASGTTVPMLQSPLPLTLSGQGLGFGAYLAVSDLAAASIARPAGSPGAAAGRVDIAPDATLATRGALTLDAPGGAQLAGTLGGAGARWILGGSDIVVGGTGGASSLAIPVPLLSQLASAASLALLSTGGVDFAAGLGIGSANAPLDALTLQAARITHSGGQDVLLDATELTLIGTASTLPAATTAPGQGNLELTGRDITLGGSALDVTGFAATTLAATAAIVARDTVALRVAGQLQVSAAQINAGNGADASLAASGDLSLSALSGPGPYVGELGGSLSLSARNIDDGAVLSAPSGLISLQATGSVTLRPTAVLDVGGVQVNAAGLVADSAGGAVRIASGGAIDMQPGSVVNVSGAGSAQAGGLTITAGADANVAGTLSAAAPGNAAGGHFQLDAGSLADFSSLVASLQAGGFTGSQLVHVASGDLTIGSGTLALAHDIELVTDQGLVTVAGTIAAPSGAERSTIRLYGGAGVHLAGSGALHADATLPADRGGLIELGAGTQGALALDAGGQVSAAGAGAGQLLLRAPVLNGNDVAIGTLDATLGGLGAITVEAVLPAWQAGATVTQADLANLETGATAYIAAAAPVIRSRLDAAGVLPLSIEPGVEIQRTGDLGLAGIDLASWRFGGAPVALTVRATGSITLTGTMSDGFSSNGSTGPGSIDVGANPSATLRFAAGSNLAAADPLGLVAGSSSDFRLAPAGILRTGTGGISVVAARDLVVGAGASIYTGGLAARPTYTASSGYTSSFATGGGNVALLAGRDVLGAATGQPPTAWLTRAGSTTDPALWGTDVSQFAWNAGTLGGGDLRISAGRNVNAISAAAADSAAVSADFSSLQRFGGGSLRIAAGNDVNGGIVYLASGTGSVSAGGAVRTNPAWSFAGSPKGLFLYVGDAQLAVAARTGVAIDGVVNPTVLRLPNTRLRAPFFFTYGAESALDVSTAAGTLALAEVPSADVPFLGSVLIGGSGTGPSYLPANLSLKSLSGDVTMAGDGFLFPSDRGNLAVLAGRDIVGLNSASLNLSDVPDAIVPTPFAPQTFTVNSTLNNVAASGRHAGDTRPATIAAGRDIINLNFGVPKAVSISAGRDMRESSVVAQNLGVADLTQITTGRDLVYSRNGGGVSVGGPGRVDVLAGGTVDFGISGGLVSTGNLRNPNLPDLPGASLTVLAGIAPAVDYSGLVAEAANGNADVATALVAFVATLTGQGGMTLAQALAAFSAAPVEVQRPFAIRTLFGELVAAGRAANADPGTNFARGYSAIDALFADSRSGNSPYAGDINLDYSRIYTLAGGDINLLAPGGRVNVGLANPPANAAARSPSQLGIVTQRSGNVDIFSSGDVLVNESRVFTLLGGNIAIWSTLGNIDAGRGAKSSLSAPPPRVLVDANGNVQLDFSGAVAGSGIRTIATSADVPPGDVDLIAPAGFVNAGDAGIGSAGNINIAASRVIGVENIQFGGAASGVPAQTSGIGASLSGVAAVGASASSASAGAAEDETAARQPQTPLAQAALSWLEVFVLGLGEDACKPDDLECLKRQRHE